MRQKLRPRRRFRDRREPYGMLPAWSSFLSCDAREMCRPTLALVRVFLMWLAAALRIFTLWLFLSDDLDTWILRAANGMSWMALREHPDFLSFQAIREEAERAQAAFRGGELGDDAARIEAKRVADALRAWSENRGSDGGLFTAEWPWEEETCRPFATYQERFAVLESEEELAAGEFACNYLVFVH